MARICDICEKGYLKGNLVPRGVGRRVTNRSIIRQQPNLRRKKVSIDGTSMTLSICSSCLKRIKYDQAKAQSSATGADSTNDLIKTS